MNRPHPASAHAGYGRLYRLAAGLLSGLLVCLMLTGCGYVWRGQEGSLSENSVLGNGSKTLKIKSVEQTSLYPWLTYQVRSLVRDDINARNLAKWVDDGQADYTLTVRIPSFKVRSYGQYRSASQLYTATISIEFIVYDGKTNTEVWRSGSIFYEENYENANEESAIKSILGKLLRQQVEELLGAHPDAGRERHVFWGDDELPPKFWEILTLQGLFSTSRVLVMRNAHALTADVWKRLSAALSRPNPQTWPLFCLEVAWEKGQPKIPAHIAKLPCFTFADAKGWIWRSPGLEPRSLRRHIQIRSKALGLDLEPGCVDILAETLLPDAAAVDAELSKLQLLAGGKPLTQEQARSVSPTTEFNVFAFLRQLQAGQTASVWKSILEEQAKGEEPLFYLLAMLQREARQLWQILAGEQVRMGPSDQQAKQQTASRLGAAGLAKLWDAMHTAELSVKSGRRSPSQALDALMGDLTLLFTPAQRRSPR